MSRNLNETLCKSELKLAESVNAETGIQNARIQELEGTVTGKNRIISLLKDQATKSLREIYDLRQKLNNVETSQSKIPLHTSTVPLPGQPNLPAHVQQPDKS